MSRLFVEFPVAASTLSSVDITGYLDRVLYPCGVRRNYMKKAILPSRASRVSKLRSVRI